MENASEVGCGVDFDATENNRAAMRPDCIRGIILFFSYLFSIFHNLIVQILLFFSGEDQEITGFNENAGNPFAIYRQNVVM